MVCELGPNQMEEILQQARTLLRAAWKHRRLGMVFAWLIGAIAAGVILRIPDKYEASARIFVDTQSILKPLMSGLAVQPNIDQQVMMLSRTLISRPNVEKLIRMSDADLNIKSSPYTSIGLFSTGSAPSRFTMLRECKSMNIWSSIFIMTGA